MNEPRQFGVSGGAAIPLTHDWSFERCQDYYAQFGQFGDSEPIHVIEYSAYEKLKEELDRHKDLLRVQCNITDDLKQQVKDYEQALEFYSSCKEVKIKFTPKEVVQNTIIFGQCENYVESNGDSAREVLKKWSGV